MSKRGVPETEKSNTPTPSTTHTTTTTDTTTPPPSSSLKIKKFLGIGNPLLDISINVDNAFLEKWKKKPGEICLASPEDLPLYPEIVSRPDAIFVAGGATQNTVRGVQWMVQIPGVTHYIGSVGDDGMSSRLKTVANSDGVETHYYVCKERTGCCAVLVVDRERCLVADLGAANHYKHEHFLTEEIQTLVKEVEIFYSAGFFLTASPQTVVELGKHCAEHDKTFLWCVSAPFIVEFYFEKVKEVLPYVDYLLGNQEEMAALLKKLEIDDKEPDVFMKKLSELPKINTKRSRIVIITQGSDPLLVFSEGKKYEFPVLPISKDLIVDTNGAGDAFLGGFIAGLLQDKPLEECVKAGLFTSRYILQVSGTQYTTNCTFEWSQ